MSLYEIEVSLLISDFFNSTATVNQEVQSKNQMGGVSRTYSERIASLLCRITDKNISELDENGKWTTVRYSMLYCDASSTNKAIEESDRVTLGTRTFQVKTIKNPGLLDKHLEVKMLEIV
jgi:hypothetical protein